METHFTIGDQYHIVFCKNCGKTYEYKGEKKDQCLLCDKEFKKVEATVTNIDFKNKTITLK